MEYNNIEKKALDFMFLDTGLNAFELIIKQISNSKVISREFTGAGFFTEIQVLKNSEYQLKIEDITFGDTLIEVCGEPYLGFLFYIDNGYLVQIEGYIFGDAELFGEEFLPTKFVFNYLKQFRDIPSVFKNN